ncbi:chitinase [Fusarium phyllophilum]|uniref:Chitinase n=1 Tax=Fusarium phyllophilum TaxID=47803 RepID=A0A8H5NAD8_9HYPO|nr:chitinase [Fusarium phyllophilum]
MRLALLFGLIGSAKASSDYFEPFPTCADCLPASVHDAPGIGFSLSLSSAAAAVHFYNGTVKNIASIPASPEYAALMKRLASSPPPSPLSRWEKLRRSLNKKIGRPATPDVGIIASMLVSLRDVTSTAVTSPMDRVAVSHSQIQGLAEPDLWDALEYAHMRPWVAAGLPRPKVVLPLPLAGGYPSRLLESYAVFAGHGKGLCKHYKNFWQCEEEQDNVPLETTLVVGISPTDLRGDIIRTWSAFTDLQPRRGDRTFVDLELGLATSEDKRDFWASVTERLQGFCGTVPEAFRLDTILLTGENATHPAFLQALRSALVGNRYLQRESDSGENISSAHEGEAVVDPVFAGARGAAQYARWRQEAPIGCEEQDRCEEERRREEKHGELR